MAPDAFEYEYEYRSAEYEYEEEGEGVVGITMKFSYLCYEPIQDLDETARRMRELAALGYAGIELTASHPLGYDVQKLASLAKETGVPVVSLLTGWSYAHEQLSLATPQAEVRQQAVERLCEYVELAGTLGAILVVGLMQGLRSDEPDTVAANERIADALVRVARQAEARGVQVVVEPVNHLQVGFNHTAAEVAQLCDRIASPAVTLMLDTIHMNIEERAPLETIRRYGPRLGHFHLCESNGGLFGSGNLDFSAILAALRAVGYERYVSVKVYRHPDWREAARSSMALLQQLGCVDADRINAGTSEQGR